MAVAIECDTRLCVYHIWISKWNIIIKYDEKNNAGEKNFNTIGPFHNLLHNLQWGANKRFFFAYHFFISYQVSNFIRSVLRTTRWDGPLFVSQIESYISCTCSLNKYIHGSSLLILLLYVYVIWCKKEYNICFSNNEKRKKKKGDDKNRFHVKIILILCYILKNTYDELSSLFSCQRISCLCVVGYEYTKERTHVRCRCLPPHSLALCWIGTIPAVSLLWCVCVCVCGCVCIIW